MRRQRVDIADNPRQPFLPVAFSDGKPEKML
jgi:hypothetical protein